MVGPARQNLGQPQLPMHVGEGGHNNNGEPSSVYMGSLVYDKDIPLILLIICFPTLGP